jgi:hypothetical protein
MVALGGAVSSAGRVLGMGLAGIVVGTAGVGSAFEVNALSFLCVVGALMAMRPHELHRRPPAERARRQVREGLGMIRRRPDLLSIVLLAAVLSCFGRSYQVTMAAMVTGPFHGGAAAYGTCSAAFAIGGLLGALGAAVAGPPRARHILWIAGGAGALQIAAGIAPTLGSFVGVIVPIAIGAVVIDTVVAASVQLGMPAEARGRAAGVVGLVGMSGSALGGVVLGVLADRFGGRVALILGGAVVVGAVVLAATASRHRAHGQFADAGSVPGGKRPEGLDHFVDRDHHETRVDHVGVGIAGEALPEHSVTRVVLRRAPTRGRRRSEEHNRRGPERGREMRDTRIATADAVGAGNESSELREPRTAGDVRGRR